MMNAKLKTREATSDDADNVVSLFTEDGLNPYHWTKEKWNHYYERYPEGEPVSIVLERSGRIVGHYGLLPVKVGAWPVMLGLHAYVASQQRGLASISALMSAAEESAQHRGFSAICGFANPSFALIKEKLFKWKTLVWLGFDDDLDSKDIDKNQTDLSFQYSDNWFLWRFGALKNIYISDYIDRKGVRSTQCLKVRSPLGESQMANYEGIEAWTKKKSYPSKPDLDRAQPFSIKVFDSNFEASGALDYRRWKIDMGDSDTFVYQPCEKDL